MRGLGAVDWVRNRCARTGAFEFVLRRVSADLRRFGQVLFRRRVTFVLLENDCCRRRPGDDCDYDQRDKLFEAFRP